MVNSVDSNDPNSKVALTSSPQKTRAFWLQNLNAYKKDYRAWDTDVKRIVDKYKAKSTVRSLRDLILASDARFNILWSNVELLKPALYARIPKPDVERRHKDNDRIARLGAEVLERSLDFEISEYDFDGPIRAAVLDYLLAGRGVCRVFYEPQFSTEIDPVTNQEIEVKTGECVKIKYVFLRDFAHGSGRLWNEVSWVAFKNYETRDSLIQRFGEELGKKIPLDYSPGKDLDSNDRQSENVLSRAQIWEIWDKETKNVYWISESYPDILDTKPDPYGLKDFFPVPEPLFATVSTDILVPVPDYILYQTHAITLDVIQQRKGAVLDAIRANGVYNAAWGTDISNILKNNDGKLWPIQNWKELSDKGGLEGIMEFVPIQHFITVLEVLDRAAETEKQNVYEITGVSDILRGATDPNETASAQQLKSEFGNLRLSARQTAVQKFIRDLISMMGEILAEKFDSETLLAISGYELMPDANPQDPMEWQQVVGLLQNDPLRRYSIDIETDSTLALNSEAQKASWTEYLTAVGGFLEQASNVVTQTPALAPFFKEALLATSRAYKAGSSLEDTLSSSFDALIQQLQQPPPPPPPDPSVQVAQINAQTAQQKMQIDQARIQGMLDVKKYQIDKREEGQIIKLQADIQKLREQMQVEIQKIQQEVAIEQAKLEGELVKAKLTADSHVQSAQLTPAPTLMPPSPPTEIHVHNNGETVKRFLVERDPTTGLMTGGTMMEAPVEG